MKTVWALYEDNSENYIAYFSSAANALKWAEEANIINPGIIKNPYAVPFCVDPPSYHYHFEEEV